MNGVLPIHGFVLAGGKSSRMGRDKASLLFLGRPMVEIAVQKLKGFCTSVSVSGNHTGLSAWAPLVRETRLEVGPVAGMEAGLCTTSHPWSLFIPVDVPLVPATLLRAWSSSVLTAQSEGVRLSYLRVHGERQPTFCLMHHDCLPAVTLAADEGERKLGLIFERISTSLGDAATRVMDAEIINPQTPSRDLQEQFGNVNTPVDLAGLESWARDKGHFELPTARKDT